MDRTHIEFLYQEEIDQFLLKKMPEDQSLRFKQEIEKDYYLKEQFEFTKKVRTAIISRNEKLAKIKEWERRYEYFEEIRKKEELEKQELAMCARVRTTEEQRKSSRSTRKKHVYWKYGIVAIVLMVIILFLIYKLVMLFI